MRAYDYRGRRQRSPKQIKGLDWRAPLTVCVAAICQEPRYPSVAIATDKMITAGDITFDGSQGKKFYLAPTIIALGAGDSSDELQICRMARAKIQERGFTGVSQAAEYFAEAYREYRAQLFENELLAPFKLTWSEFHSRQQDLSSDFVSRVDRLVRDNYLPLSGREFGCSTIIAGTDTESGPLPNWITAHIYIVSDPGQVSCEDSVGFAAVGSGRRHAETYLMLDRYAIDRSLDHALLSVYAAKRNSESAPGVGPETELIRLDVTGPGLASSEDLKGIESIYQRVLKGRARINETARKQMAAFMESLNSPEYKAWSKA